MDRVMEPRSVAMYALCVRELYQLCINQTLRVIDTVKPEWRGGLGWTDRYCKRQGEIQALMRVFDPDGCEGLARDGRLGAQLLMDRVEMSVR